MVSAVSSGAFKDAFIFVSVAFFNSKLIGDNNSWSALSSLIFNNILTLRSLKYHVSE